MVATDAPTLPLRNNPLPCGREGYPRSEGFSKHFDFCAATLTPARWRRHKGV
jgi:hypothetical protein